MVSKIRHGFSPSEWNTTSFKFGFSWLKALAQGGLGRSSYAERTTAAGKRQYEMTFGGKKWMMLVSDMALLWDPDYHKHVLFYHNHRKAFKQDAVAAWTKLIELGCDDLVPEAVPQKGGFLRSIISLFLGR